MDILQIPHNGYYFEIKCLWSYTIFLLYILGLLLTFWTHFTFFICNNLIGLVYFKQDDKKVILSYLNYWGKRTDLTTSLQNIVPLTDTPVNIASSLYRKLDIVSCKQKLKISIPYGKITEKTHFEIIFGSV